MTAVEKGIGRLWKLMVQKKRIFLTPGKVEITTGGRFFAPKNPVAFCTRRGAVSR